MRCDLQVAKPGDGRATPSLKADVQAQCTVIFRAIASAGESEVDTAGLIARYGLVRVADFLAQMIRDGMTRVARKRGQASPEVILDEYIDRFFRDQTDELRNMVRSQIRQEHHPPISDPGTQEHFLWGLLTLQCGAVIELAGKRTIQ
jgi:hypothetical protein